jgi:hypothetical protein
LESLRRVALVGFTGAALWLFIRPLPDLGFVPPVLLVSALLAYVALPRRRFRTDELRYDPLRMVILPDLGGTAMAAVFFALPIVIATINTPDLSPLSPEGPLWVTLFLWLLSALLLLVVRKAWRASYSAYRLVPEGVEYNDGSAAVLYRFEEMESLRATGASAPSSFDIVRPGLAAAVRRNPERHVIVRMKSGEHLEILLNHLEQGDAILQALRSREIVA